LYALLEISPNQLFSRPGARCFEVCVLVRGVLFEIRETGGTANIDVSYRIVAKRKGFADERLKKEPTPKPQSLEMN
jgi:hypothetical protein